MEIGVKPVLCQGKPFYPFMRFVTSEGFKVLFQTSINNLSLPIRLRVISSGHRQLSPLKFEQLKPK